jgi:hypothetical protein
MKKFSNINERKIQPIELDIEDILMHIIDENKLINYYNEDGTEKFKYNLHELWEQIPSRWRAAYQIKKIKSSDEIYDQRNYEIMININSSENISDIREQIRERLEDFGWIVKCTGTKTATIKAIKKKK